MRPIENKMFAYAFEKSNKANIQKHQFPQTCSCCFQVRGWHAHVNEQQNCLQTSIYNMSPLYARTTYKTYIRGTVKIYLSISILPPPKFTYFVYVGYGNAFMLFAFHLFGIVEQRMRFGTCVCVCMDQVKYWITHVSVK